MKVKVQDRAFFEGTVKEYFEEREEGDAALSAYKDLCTATLGETLDAACGNEAPDFEVDLQGIKADFMRRITELQRKGLLSAAALTAATGAIEDAVPAPADLKTQGPADEKKEKEEQKKEKEKNFDDFTVEMFKKGVKRFCTPPGNPEDAQFKDLFLITARNAIRQDLRLTEFILEETEKKDQFEKLNQEIVAKNQVLKNRYTWQFGHREAIEDLGTVQDQQARLVINDLLRQQLENLGKNIVEKQGEILQLHLGVVFGGPYAERKALQELEVLQKQREQLAVQCLKNVVSDEAYYPRFMAAFETLYADEILATETALSTFAKGENENLVPVASRPGLSEYGVFKESNYITTPHYLLDCNAVDFREFLNNKVIARRAEKDKMNALATYGDDTHSSEKSVYASFMRLVVRYIPEAQVAVSAEEERLNKKLNHAEKRNILNPIIRAWEPKQNFDDMITEVNKAKRAMTQKTVLGTNLNDKERAEILAPIVQKWRKDHNGQRMFIAEIFDCLEARKVEADKDSDTVVKWLSTQAVRSEALKRVVARAYGVHELTFSQLVTHKVSGSKAWTDHLFGQSDRPEKHEGVWRSGKQGLKPEQKADFQKVLMADVEGAFNRLIGEFAQNVRPAHETLGLQNLLLSTLSIVWEAINDRTQIWVPGKKPSDPEVRLEDTNDEIMGSDGKRRKQCEEITRVIQLKKLNLLQAFWEFQTEYGTGPSCAHGTYNKIVESLNLMDPDVRIGALAEINIEAILNDLKLKFIPAILEEAATKSANFPLDTMRKIWSADELSKPERALLKGFREHVRGVIRERLPAYLEREFPEYVARLKEKRTFENCITFQIIPDVMESLQQLNLGPPPKWTRERLKELTYDEALKMHPELKGTDEQTRPKALRRVKASKISHLMEEILIDEGLKVCVNEGDDPEGDVVSKLAPRLGQMLTRPLGPDEKLDAEQCIRDVLIEEAPVGTFETVNLRLVLNQPREETLRAVSAGKEIVIAKMSNSEFIIFYKNISNGKIGQIKSPYELNLMLSPPSFDEGLLPQDPNASSNSARIYSQLYEEVAEHDGLIARDADSLDCINACLMLAAPRDADREAVKRGDVIIIAKMLVTKAESEEVTEFVIFYKSTVNDEVCELNCSDGLKALLWPSSVLPIFNGELFAQTASSEAIYKKVYNAVALENGCIVSDKVASLTQRLLTAFTHPEQEKQPVKQQPTRLLDSVQLRRVTAAFFGGLETQRLENVGTTRLYPDLQLPQLPSVFPYDPIGDERVNLGAPTFSVAATIQEPKEDQVPAGVLEQLALSGLSLKNLAMSFVVQDMPWKDSTFLFRPHPYLHSEAENQRHYIRSSDIKAGISGIGESFPSLGTIDSVQTHYSRRAQKVVYAGGQEFTIEQAQDFQQTHCFYSLCVEPAANRAVLTYHWLLNDVDHAQISGLLPNTPSLGAFSEKVARLGKAVTLNEPINGVSPVQALNAMLQGNQPILRPSVGQYRLAVQSEMHIPQVEQDEKAPGEVAARIARQAAEAEIARAGAPLVMHFGPGVGGQPAPVVPVPNPAAGGAAARPGVRGPRAGNGWEDLDRR